MVLCARRNFCSHNRFTATANSFECAVHVSNWKLVTRAFIYQIPSIDFTTKFFSCHFKTIKRKVTIKISLRKIKKYRAEEKSTPIIYFVHNWESLRTMHTAFPMKLKVHVHSQTNIIFHFGRAFLLCQAN